MEHRQYQATPTIVWPTVIPAWDYAETSQCRARTGRLGEQAAVEVIDSFVSPALRAALRVHRGEQAAEQVEAVRRTFAFTE